MKHSVLRRSLSVLLCVSLLLGVSVVRPQKAEAFAISASVVASVAAIMTACGVTYWASTQQDAIDYLGGKIDAYLGSLETVPQSYEDWLGINATSQLFDVVSGGVMRFGSGVANKVLDFVRWFNVEEGVVSGGPSVGASTLPSGWSVTYSGDDYDGGWSADLTGVNTITVSMDGFSKAGTGLSYMTVLIPVSGSSCQIQLVDVSGTPRMTVRLGTSTSQLSCQSVWNRSRDAGLSDGFVTLTFVVSNVSSYHDPFSGTSVFTIFPDYDVARDYTSEVTPSPVVAVPDSLSDADSFDVAPSVPLSQGMTVDQASEAVLDGVASEDGLTSVGEAVEAPALDLSGILDFLGRILNAILAIPGHIAALPSSIASAFSSLLTSIKSVLDSIEDWVASIAQTVLGLPEVIGQAAGQAAQDVITGIHSLPGMISDALVNLFVPDEAYIGEFVASLHGIFDNRFSILSYPFSILGEFITRASGIDEDEPILRWPDIYEPFSGQLLIAAGSYNLNQIRQGNFSQAHGLYMVVLKGWISFEFLGYLYSWFCSVFKMREDDFVSPLEAYDGGDDG